MKREGTLVWTTTDDPYHSDSDCEEVESSSYKVPKNFVEPLRLFWHASWKHGVLKRDKWLMQIWISLSLALWVTAVPTGHTQKHKRNYMKKNFEVTKSPLQKLEHGWIAYLECELVGCVIFKGSLTKANITWVFFLFIHFFFQSNMRQLTYFQRGQTAFFKKLEQMF